MLETVIKLNGFTVPTTLILLVVPTVNADPFNVAEIANVVLVVTVACT